MGKTSKMHKTSRSSVVVRMAKLMFSISNERFHRNSCSA